MIRTLSWILSWTLALTLTGCGAPAPAESDPAPSVTEEPAQVPETVPETPVEAPETTEETPEDTPEETPDEAPRAPVLTVTVGDQTFTATLSDTAAASSWAELLPMTVSMSERTGNEKYVYLDPARPTDASAPGTLPAGDILLYGSDCVVLFYETFSSSYRYTPLAALDDPAGLAEAVGSGGVTVTFALED